MVELRKIQFVENGGGCRQCRGLYNCSTYSVNGDIAIFTIGGNMLNTEFGGKYIQGWAFYNMTVF